MSGFPTWVGWAAGSWGVSWGYASVEVEPDLVPAGHWKHLFRPIRAATAEEIRVKAASRAAYLRPEVADLRQQATVPLLMAKCAGTSHVRFPTGGVFSPKLRIEVGSITKVSAPQCGASPYLMRAFSQQRLAAINPVSGSTVSLVTATGRGYYSFYTPKTVQNPTEEMLLAL